MTVPVVVVAGTQSGVGKTSVATGLMRALRGRGIAVAGFKVGPDFIDPTYHALATGRPGRNLDAYLCPPDSIAPLVRHGAQGADIAVVEGVMGLFDGKTGSGELASTVHVAKLLGAPVLLVVDAASVARSIAAVVHGFMTFDPSVTIAGVVLNRVGSDTHEMIVRDALASLGVPVVGVVRRRIDLGTRHRHLGLIPVAEQRADAERTVDVLGGAIGKSCDVESIVALARSALVPDGPRWDPAGARTGDALIAVAGGPAFTFVYEENLELMRGRGAEVAFFDPTSDAALPDGTTALYLGGGFPEVFGEALSANEPMRTAVRAFAEAGRPVLAECGGYLYLCRTLDGHPMCGVLPADGAMTDRLTLGYRETHAASASVIASAGDVVRGHEFHYGTVEPGAGASPAWDIGGFVQGGVHASFLHTHWAGAPELADAFVRAAASVGATA